MWPFKKQPLLTKAQEKPLGDPTLGKAFRLVFGNDAKTPEVVEAFRTVAAIMAKRLDSEELLTVASFTGIELHRPNWLRLVKGPGECEP